MTHNFWCDRCELDFEAPGYRTGYSLQGGAEWFVGFDPRGHKAIRYITEKHLDPYFRKSRNLKEQRVHYRKDLLQPGQRGFKQTYPDAQREMDKAEDIAYNKKDDKKSYYDKLNKDAGIDEARRKAVRTAERAEEKWH